MRQVLQLSAAAAPRAERRRMYLLALLVTVPAGLVWRFAPLHLPPFAFKYGGSALWAVAVYWVVRSVRPCWALEVAAVVTGLISLLVELLKKVYWEPLDRFRETLAGKLLLGRYFSHGALVAYFVAIGVAAALDDLAARRRRVV